MACSKLKGFGQVVSFVSEQAWNAFEDSTGNLPLEGNKQGSELQLDTHNLSSTSDQYLGLRDLEVCTFTSNIFRSVYFLLFILKHFDLQDSSKEGIQRASHGGSMAPSLPSNGGMGPLYTPMLPLMVCTLQLL